MPLLTNRTGVLAAAQGTTGVSANAVNIDGWDAVVLYIQVVAAGSTCQVEQSIDGGVTFAAPIFAVNVATGATGSTAGSANALFRIDNPAGIYRTNVTAFVGAATANYKIGAVYQE